MAVATDLTNKIFGKLRVLERDFTVPSGKPVRWFCQCECGMIKSIAANNLRTGHVLSCGCLHKNKTSANLQGKTFGKLTVLKDTGKRTKNRSIIWLCQCECGNICEVTTNNLQQKNTMSCGCLKQSHGEYLIEQFLLLHNILYKKEYCFSDLISDKGGYLRFDFAIFNKEELIYLVEYDGNTHRLEELSGWLTKEKVLLQQKNDELKNFYCQANNIPLLRITCFDDIEPKLKEICKCSKN